MCQNSLLIIEQLIGSVWDEERTNIDIEDTTGCIDSLDSWSVRVA